jgi:hypothetical protein
VYYISKSIGSIEVNDHKQQKLVPYTPNPEKWYQHFKDLRDGYVKADHKGRYIVGSGNQLRKIAEMKQSPPVKLVSPVAQAIEIAKSEVNRKKVELGKERKKGPQKRKKTPITAYKSSKRNRTNPEFQF